MHFIEVGNVFNKIKSFLLWLAVFFMFVVQSYAADYILGPGDVISVTIFNEDDMSLPVSKIPKRGKLAFPLIGEIKVIGLSTRKLKRKLISKLKDGYLKNPQLIINIVQYRAFFVNGEVKRPGSYPFVEGLTIRKAISIAGGLTDRASIKKMSIVKESENNSVRVNSDLELALGPGDVLTIGESLF